MSRSRISKSVEASAELSLELEEAVEVLCDTVSQEEISKVLELEESEALEEAVVASKEIQNWIIAIEAWPQEDESLWEEILRSERLRSVLTAIMIAATKGDRSVMCGAGVAFCKMATVKSAPVSLASPGLLRCIIRLLEDKPPSASAPKRKRPKSRQQKKKKRHQDASDEEEDGSSYLDSDEHDDEDFSTKRQKRGHDAFSLYAALCDWLQSPEWIRHMAELERTDHSELVGRLAKVCATRSSPHTVLRALLATGSEAVARALVPSLLEANGKEIVKALLLVEKENDHNQDFLAQVSVRLMVDGADANSQKIKKIPSLVASLVQSDDTSSFITILQEKLLLSGKAKLRALAVEVAVRGLADDRLKLAALARMHDKCPAVRCRAIQCLAESSWFPADDFAALACSDPKQAVRARAMKALALRPRSQPETINNHQLISAAVKASLGTPSLKLAGIALLGNWYLETTIPHHAFVDAVLVRAGDTSPAVAAKVSDFVFAWLRKCTQEVDFYWQAADLVASSQRRLKALKAALRKSKDVDCNVAFDLLNSSRDTAVSLLAQFPDDVLQKLLVDKGDILLQRASNTGLPDQARAAALNLLGNYVDPVPKIHSFDPLQLGPAACAALAAHGDSAWRWRQIERCRSRLPEVNAIRALGTLLGGRRSDYQDDDTVSSILAELADLMQSDQHEISAEAVAALGRACAPSSRLTKQYIKKISREIAHGASRQIRISACLALSELCIDHASACEPRLSILGKALSCDHDVYLRRHAIVLLARLVARDFVKWRVDLVHRCFAALADPDTGVSRLAQAALTQVILPKLPSLVITHFTALVFVLNGARCASSQHSSHNGLAEVARAAVAGLAANASPDFDTNDEILQTTDTPRSFELDLARQCASSSSRRTKIYTQLLDAVPDEAKIQIAAKLAKDILANAADNLLGDLHSSESPAAAIVADALKLLATDLLVASSSSKHTDTHDDLDDDDDLDNDDLAPSAEKINVPAALIAARSRLLSKMSKKHLLEQILPILISLKSNLEQHKSPILAVLMKSLRQILAKYGNEVTDVLNQDPHLALELEYDLKLMAKSTPPTQASPQQAQPTPRRAPA